MRRIRTMSVTMSQQMMIVLLLFLQKQNLGIELIPPAEGRGLIEFGVVLISRVEFKKIVG
jgi:hypothetical protein